MPKTAQYKLQGNGKHSWKVTTTDDLGNIIKEEIVYSDDINFNPASNVEKAVKLTDFELLKLKELLSRI